LFDFMLRVRENREFGFQGWIRSSFFGSYRRVGSALPPNLRFHVSKTSFHLGSSALSAFFFRLCFKPRSFRRIQRYCFESLLRKIRCSRLYEQLVEIQCFAKSSLLGEVESLHLLHDQQKAFDCFSKSSLYSGKYAVLGFTNSL
jgi:hypothetical protein